MPAPAARDSDRTPGARAAATARSAAVAAPLPMPISTTWSAPMAGGPSAGSISDTSPASATTMTAAPAHSEREVASRRIGSAKTSVSAPSGWTIVTGPNLSAATCRAAPARFSPTAPDHPSGPAVGARAMRRCATAPSA
ncbi:hypothetical protein [Sphaerisporangium album]|nr:hypothetical protein [Sphaerisporangium album]